MTNNTITITREDFRDICMNMLHETLQDKDLKGSAAFVVPMMKMIFTQELESKLFGEEEEEKDE